jgi:hypothetical protein
MLLESAKKYLENAGYSVIMEKSKYDGIKDSTPVVKELIETLKSSGLKADLDKAADLEAKLAGLTEDNLNEMQKAKKWKAEWTAKESSLKGTLDEAAKYLGDALDSDEALFFKVASKEQKAGILLEKVPTVTSQKEVEAMILKVMQNPTVVSDASELAQQMANDFKNLLQSYYQRALDAGWVKLGEVKTSWRPAYYDQDDEGNMKKFIGKKEQEADRAEWQAKSVAARKANKAAANESYIMDEGFFGDVVEKFKAFGSWIWRKITGEFKDARIETRKALIHYGKELDALIDACEAKLAEVEE